MGDVVHQFNSNMAPDSDFRPGEIKHLVVGNRGRLLDPRRTPIMIVDLIPQTGHFIVRIDDFEDKGARWEVGFEEVSFYQFALESAEGQPSEVERFSEIARRLSQPFQIPCDPVSATRTMQNLAELQRDAAVWLGNNSNYLKKYDRIETKSRQGPSELFDDLKRFMGQHDLADVESGFAACYVSGPHYRELEGHRMMMAELGIVAFDGTIVRDPSLYEGRWSKERRALHILCRLAFLRAFLSTLGVTTVTLFRGLVLDHTTYVPRNRTFVSASFDLEVAQSCFALREAQKSGLLMRQVVPIGRLFMTYLETAAMNRQFLEAEAVLLYEPENPLF